MAHLADLLAAGLPADFPVSDPNNDRKAMGLGPESGPYCVLPPPPLPVEQQRVIDEVLKMKTILPISRKEHPRDLKRSGDPLPPARVRSIGPVRKMAVEAAQALAREGVAFFTKDEIRERMIQDHGQVIVEFLKTLPLGSWQELESHGQEVWRLAAKKWWYR